jgi:hypothetical protein
MQHRLHLMRDVELNLSFFKQGRSSGVSDISLPEEMLVACRARRQLVYQGGELGAGSSAVSPVSAAPKTRSSRT